MMKSFSLEKILITVMNKEAFSWFFAANLQTTFYSPHASPLPH